MPFIPHTEQDVLEMLETIGVNKCEDLFAEIPKALINQSLDNIPEGTSEMALGPLARERASKDDNLLCFLGAGSYQHHIPAIVWEIATRGEFMTAYTPYQAEASQGILQLIYEYQTMLANLLSMEVSNASLYDGASALSEAILMAARLRSKGKQPAILIPRAVHPFYRQTVFSIVKQQGIRLLEIPFDTSTGRIHREELARMVTEDVIALVIPQPNFFGILEEVDFLTDWALQKNILSIALVNPIAMALLKPPGQWGTKGADIACGEGQPLGVPIASGGPYFGFLCCKNAHVRQMPGRIVGQTIDMEGKRGFVLTLQAREQHIRRGKATSNICTNQGLMVTAATIYMSVMGPMGLRRVAEESHAKTRLLSKKLTAISGVTQVFDQPYFNEIVLQLDRPAEMVLKNLAQYHIQGGFALQSYYPELKNTILVCATEIKTEAQIDSYATHLKIIMHGEKQQTSSPGERIA